MKEVLRVAWPLIIANSFWNIQMTIDRIFLGHYSTESLGAAIAVFGVFWAPMALLQQTAAYVTTFVAQYHGAKRARKIGAATWQAIYVSVAGGLLFLLLIFVSEPWFSVMGHSPRLQVLESQYFSAMCFSALPTALVAVASGFFTGMSRTSVIMWINGVAMLSNIGLDYLLIFGNYGFPALGIQGAGYATAGANWFGAIFGLGLLFRKSNEKRYAIRSAWRFDRELMGRFLKYGVPSGLQWALEGLAFTVFLLFVGQMVDGEAALAASGIAVTIMMMAVLPAIGVGQGVSVLVGQYLGDDKPKNAETASWSGVKIAAIYMVVMGSTFILFPQFYLQFFANSENPELWSKVSVMVPYLLMFVAAFTAFDGFNMVFSAALKGAGDTRFVTLVALTLPWPLMNLPVFLTKDYEGSIYWAWGFASFFIITQALVFLARFMGGKWKSMRVI